MQFLGLTLTSTSTSTSTSIALCRGRGRAFALAVFLLCCIVSSQAKTGGEGGKEEKEEEEEGFVMEKYGVLGKRPPILRASIKVKEAKSREEAWRDWADANHAAYIDDTYATGLHPYWRAENGHFHQHWDHSTRSKTGVGFVGKSYNDFGYLTDYRMYRAEKHYDPYHHASLTAQRNAATADTVAAGIDILEGGEEAAAMAFWLGYQYAYQDSNIEVHMAHRENEPMELDAAYRALDSTGLWNMAFAFDVFPRIQDEEIFNKLVFAASVVDYHNTAATYDDADYLYYKDPTEENWHAREVAGILLDAAMNQQLWGLTHVSDTFEARLDGFTRPIFEYNTYNTWSQASRYEADYAAEVYYDKYGSWPEHDYYHYYDY